MEKRCKECGATNRVEAFHKDRSKPDGLNFYCKECAKTRQARFNLHPPRFQTPEGMRRCSGCKEIKPKSEFSANKNMYEGIDRRCKACAYETHNAWRLKNLGHAAEQQKRWRTENKDRAADYFLKRLYGIAPGEYNEMLKAQNGGCAICHRPEPAEGKIRRLHVDHDHATGHIRGLLCHGCNVSIGHFQHNRDILWSAIEYLDRPLPVAGTERRS